MEAEECGGPVWKLYLIYTPKGHHLNLPLSGFILPAVQLVSFDTVYLALMMFYVISDKLLLMRYSGRNWTRTSDGSLIVTWIAIGN